MAEDNETIETVTVEASRLTDWTKVLIIGAIAYGFWKLFLDRAERDIL